ncbi:cilia- and flagella-associated protein 251 [Anguilla anguilla]|uniref:VGF nerve growth factor inducible n=1 Tax=Anguilla anguilla TaxID=7936 RepID=A0A9D3MNF5_ANGAN|nr:cilia- and flagella-associated protein 251 [Anguilla anguilla]KAG5852106.1 hypothetical protein ANANG_G00058930 [Anguilla anguilla]
MTRCQHTSSAPVVLLILFGITQQLSATIPLIKGGHSNDDINVPPPPGLAKLFQSELEGGQVRVDKEQNPTQSLPEEEDELFKDVDPKTLAAVLLEALNQPGESKKSSRVEMEEKNRGAEGEGKGQEELALLGSDRDRDGKQELELVMAAAAAEGKEEQEREEEERKRAEKEEEQLTEKVKSRTTSQAMPVKEQPEKEAVKEQETREEEHQEPGDEEEQLSSQEVKNLQTMLEELQSYSTATKRERDSGGQRESRGSFQDMDNGFLDNDIKPKPKGYQLALSKKKLKWQEEEQKKKNTPLYRGGNFMDDFDDNIKGQNEEDKEDEEDEEVLSPEEEEARAKADQEEVRRQAAEAQRAKAEEERLADIASDMLLQYMVKQDGKKYMDQSKKTSQGNNAAEDKRSEEEDDSDDDDIDPQTIDKLIEISSKLHLPADDVVDIISDVEKKKKKDAPENVPWHRPVAPAPAPAPAPRNPAPKLSSSLTSPSKTWVKDKAVVKPSKQDFWPKLQKQFRTYPTYSFVQKPYRGYFPIYFPPPKPKPQYYTKPTFSFNDLLGNSLDYDFGFPPKRRYRPWAQPRSRNPPPIRRNLYFNYILPHPRTFKPVPMPKPRSPPRRRPTFYYPPPAPMVPRNEDYFDPVGQQQQDNDEELENFIEKVFLKHPRMFQ